MNFLARQTSKFRNDGVTAFFEKSTGAFLEPIFTQEHDFDLRFGLRAHLGGRLDIGNLLVARGSTDYRTDWRFTGDSDTLYGISVAVNYVQRDAIGHRKQ